MVVMAMLKLSADTDTLVVWILPNTYSTAEVSLKGHSRTQLHHGLRGPCDASWAKGNGP
jgi:hypothetical protein